MFPIFIFRYVFLCDNWLSADKADGLTYRVLFPSNTELKDGKILFNSITRFRLFDDYLWLSILSRPSFSRFSRVQRLMCVSSMISLSMLGSAMWYKAKLNGDVHGLKIGPFKLSYIQLYVGLMTSLMSFPPALVIGMIFRNRQLKGEREYIGTHSYERENPFKRDASLPWFSIFGGYALVGASVGCGSFFTTLYSLQWGGDISAEWLMSIVLGTVNEIAFFEPIKVCISNSIYIA